MDVAEALKRIQIKQLDRLFIDGAWVEPSSDGVIDVVSPVTEEVIFRCAEAQSADMDRAVAAARRAFDRGPWPRMSHAERAAWMRQLGEALKARSEELGHAWTNEMGVLHAISQTSGAYAFAAFDRYAAFADTFEWEEPHVPSRGTGQALLVREPVGVCAAVVTWNNPLGLACSKLAPGFLAGCTFVLKVAPEAPLDGYILAECAEAIGLPPGVLNVVAAHRPASEHLIRNPGIDKVAFTGSTEVGRDFLHYAAESNLKRVMLELGGKSPQVVMADVSDLDNLVTNAANAIFWNMGENCSAGSRMIVHESRRDEVLDRLVAHVEREWIVGDPLDPATRVGALISKGHMERVLDYVATGRSEGARVATGGARVREDSGGWFVQPTIFDGTTNDMRIAREEIFGPVLSVMTFRTEAEAVAIANDTPYGLGASLYTDDLHVAHRVSRALKAGTVGVNCYSEGDLTTPFGGFKQSGFGGHDKSLRAHDQYTETKTIWIQLRTEAD
jgi:acyl-CoA reductase-like NAD-dependent aldehyde dehydrogenase